MTNPLDRLLAHYEDRPGPDLEGLEDKVWARIERLQPANLASASWGLKAAMVSGALALGLAVGGAGAAAAGAHGSGEMTAFGTRLDLAPSTLLEGVG